VFTTPDLCVCVRVSLDDRSGRNTACLGAEASSLLVQPQKVTDSVGSAREEQREALVRRVSRERALYNFVLSRSATRPLAQSV
jgi:hypothetical protein